METYLDILERFEKQGISTDGKSILIQGHSLSINGERISGISVSKDGKWVCIPVYDDEASSFTGGYEFRPQCYEILEKFQCYTGNNILALTEVWLLNNGY